MVNQETGAGLGWAWRGDRGPCLSFHLLHQLLDHDGVHMVWHTNGGIHMMMRGGSGQGARAQKGIKQSATCWPHVVLVRAWLLLLQWSACCPNASRVSGPARSHAALCSHGRRTQRRPQATGMQAVCAEPHQTPHDQPGCAVTTAACRAQGHATSEGVRGNSPSSTPWSL